MSSEPLKSVGAITMFVADRDRAKSFYERVFDAESVYEDDQSAAFKFDNMIVNLLAASEAPDLIGPASVAGPDAGSRFQLTIGVNDVDAVCDELARRGVELLNGPVDRPWGMRTAAFADPDGHIWEVAAEIPS
jgi:lactoylglutathione lyase